MLSQGGWATLLTVFCFALCQTLLPAVLYIIHYSTLCEVVVYTVLVITKHCHTAHIPTSLVMASLIISSIVIMLHRHMITDVDIYSSIVLHSHDFSLWTPPRRFPWQKSFPLCLHPNDFYILLPSRSPLLSYKYFILHNSPVLSLFCLVTYSEFCLFTSHCFYPVVVYALFHFLILSSWYKPLTTVLTKSSSLLFFILIIHPS